MHKNFILLISTIFLVGCGAGGGGNTSSTGEPADEDVLMEVNKPYTAYPGNKLQRDSDTAKVSITHTDGQTSSTVTLLSGSASIIRKP